ncbi:IS3 family transposase [Mycoplasmopsis pullorum]|uniref:IS3 family transposase n=1 Tax=Mycoplasmopsis pullorum TaxID=48003 RepID=UPI000A06F48C|nr:IS3 family transposase [Mycoplasmopsis pullorum]
MKKMPKEQLIEILEIFKDSFDKNNIEVGISKIEKSSISSRRLSVTFNKSKSTIHNIKNGQEKTNKLVINKNKHDDLIIEAFKKNKCLFGRVRLANYIREKYQIYLNYRTLGRIMNRLGLFCVIRRKRKQREQKDTKC